jgi:hypothetical protein
MTPEANVSVSAAQVVAPYVAKASMEEIRSVREFMEVCDPVNGG